MSSENSMLPTEIELALEVMPCQAMHLSHEPIDTPHACAFFGGVGAYHSYDYATSGAPDTPGIEQRANYKGKRRLIPEILSGCRKAPIMAVGINPNLPGFWEGKRGSLNPIFDDFHQFAHYFRYRALAKLQIPPNAYEVLREGRADDPFDGTPLMPIGAELPTEAADQTMYKAYQSLLDGLAEKMGWNEHELTVGEDLSYGNMVACPSAKWQTRPDSKYPHLPVMSDAEVQGIVSECFHERRYFLRQLFQSLPAVLLVFSGATRDAFITAMRGHFVEGEPKVGESLEALLARPVRLRYGTTEDGEELTARVIFTPHASGNPAGFAETKARVIEILAEEARAGRITLKKSNGHLGRPRGDCSFCENALYRIGACDYQSELIPLRRSKSGEPELLSVEVPTEPTAITEKKAQERLLRAFLPSPAEKRPERTSEGLLGGSTRLSTYVLAGDIATMNDAGDVIRNGRVYINGSDIVAVSGSNDKAPEGFLDAQVIHTEGTIYPGLLDLHNHLVYNVLTLWNVPKKFSNRSKWRTHPEYKSLVSMPLGALAKPRRSAMAIVRYVETKALLGGTTTHQGMRSMQKGLLQYFQGLVRNFEAPSNKRLPSASGTLMDLRIGVAGEIDKFKNALKKHHGYFYHLSEGVDDDARQFFVDLRDNGLLAPSLLGIHSLALRPADYKAMAKAGAKVVWSPLSNMLLYGSTISPMQLAASGVSFAFGCDWSPSGSKNLLEELKVARLVIDNENAPITNETLCAAVTRVAANAVGWGDALGVVGEGRLADLLVVRGKGGDVYERLVRATERDVTLVVIDGVARHGDANVMRSFGISDAELELLTVGGKEKCLYLAQEDDTLEGMRFDEATETLTSSMSRLRDLDGELQWDGFDPRGGFSVMPDFEDEDSGEEGLLASVEMPESVPLDPATVVDDASYMDRLAAIEHFPAFVVEGLKRFYANG